MDTEYKVGDIVEFNSHGDVKSIYILLKKIGSSVWRVAPIAGKPGIIVEGTGEIFTGDILRLLAHTELP